MSCTFSNNIADNGGAMQNTNSNPTIDSCSFSGNTPNYGGAMYNSDSNPTITNSTFSNNTANYNGGAMLNSTVEMLSAKINGMSNKKQLEQAQILLHEWHQVSCQLLSAESLDIAGAATDYLHYSGYVIVGILWLQMADAAKKSSNPKIKVGKAKTCDFYIKRILPRKDVHKALILSSAEDLMSLEESEFDY